MIIDYSKPFMLSVEQTAAATGLSRSWIRKNIKSGFVPAISSGNKYLINLPLLIERINAASLESADGQREANYIN